MEGQQLRQLLEQVQAGQLSVVEAAVALESSGVAELGYATVDLHRGRRCGHPEVIFCEGKTPAWVEGVVRRLIEEGQDCLATRVNDAQAAHLAPLFPAAEQDRTARTFWLPVGPREEEGNVLVLTAGTSDIPVAREAANTLKAMAVRAELIADVGVAGLHRLLRHHGKLTSADVIIVVAGMDGALPSVVGGLV